MEATFNQYKNNEVSMSSFLKGENLMDGKNGFTWSSSGSLRFGIWNPVPEMNFFPLFFLNQLSGHVRPVISISGLFNIRLAEPQDIRSFMGSLVKEKEESFSLLVKSGIESNPTLASLARMTLIRLSCQILSGDNQNALSYFAKDMPIERVLRAESLKPTTSEEIDVIEALPDSWFNKILSGKL